MEFAAELFVVEFASRWFVVELLVGKLIEKSASSRSVIWAVLSI